MEGVDARTIKGQVSSRVCEVSCLELIELLDLPHNNASHKNMRGVTFSLQFACLLYQSFGSNLFLTQRLNGGMHIVQRYPTDLRKTMGLMSQPYHSIRNHCHQYQSLLQ